MSTAKSLFMRLKRCPSLSMVPNPSVNRTPRKLRLRVPFALRVPVAGYRTWGDFTLNSMPRVTE